MIHPEQLKPPFYAVSAAHAALQEAKELPVGAARDKALARCRAQLFTALLDLAITVDSLLHPDHDPTQPAIKH